MPWRCLHRDLRLAIPQPRRGAAAKAVACRHVGDTSATARGQWRRSSNKSCARQQRQRCNGTCAPLIVEFRESRSEYFAWALRQAKKQPGFQQLMDEDRHIVYRAPFRRNEARKFWSLWECVQGWSNSRVYCQGRELEKWQVYSGSQYMR